MVKGKRLSAYGGRTLSHAQQKVCLCFFPFTVYLLSQ